MKLVMIHGRSQGGKDATQLKNEWIASLNKGIVKAGKKLPPNIEIEFPFYGDILDKLVQQVDAPLTEEVIHRGAKPNAEADEFRSDILKEMVKSQGITEAEINKEFQPEVLDRGPENWEWVQGLLKVLDSTPLGQKAIDKFTRDVYVYLTFPGVRRKIDAFVSSAIKDTPCVVIGHSLGSIIGYNVLHKLDTKVDIVKYVTLGSPLGIKAIRKHLDSPLSMPRSTQSWYNALDERDVVALYPLDKRHFPITPRIVNRIDVDNYTDNRHGIEGYLEDPYVGKTISQALDAI